MDHPSVCPEAITLVMFESRLLRCVFMEMERLESPNLDLKTRGQTTDHGKETHVYMCT
jgi:hypothetical protein